MMDIDDQALLERLSKADCATRLKNSDEWKLFEESCRRVAENAKNKLSIVDPDNKIEIVRLQLKVSIYGDVVNWIIGQLQDGHAAFEEAKARDLVNR